MFWKPFENENQDDGYTQKRQEAKYEQILKEILLELDKGRKITLKDKQKKAVRQLYGKKDLVAVLPPGFRKSFIFQLLVFLENRNQNGHCKRFIVLEFLK